MAIDNHPFTKGLPFICSTLVFAAERGFNPQGDSDTLDAVQSRHNSCQNFARRPV
jgi:hypothetical protein